jgi:hypothetical protein
MKKEIIPDYRYGFPNGFIIVNYLYDEKTDKKNIPEYYTGKSRDYSDKSKMFSRDINDAEFFSYTNEKSATSMVQILNINIPGYPGVFCYHERAHLEMVQ